MVYVKIVVNVKNNIINVDELDLLIITILIKD